jgi:hypothetical protein
MEMKNLPAVLKGKLKFGNRNQIDALRQMEADVEKQEERTNAKLNGDLKYYGVEIKVEGRFFTNVWAQDEAQAQDLAADEFDGDLDDCECTESNAWATKPSVNCMCYTGVSKECTTKPYNWDKCPVHGHTVFSKQVQKAL